MSIILKGIDLPTNGETLIVGIYGDGNVSIEHSKPLVLAIEPSAEAVQIPKGHGRLKDFDWNGIHPIIVDGVYMVKVDDLDEIPTILKAEGAE